MNRHSIFRLFALVLLLCMLSLCTAAYTVNLYDGDTLTDTKTGTDGQALTLPELLFENGSYLLGYENRLTSELHGWRFYPTGEINLYSVWTPVKKAVPGQNVYVNGDFEGNDLALRPSNGTVRIVTEANGNHALEYVRGSGYASIQRYVGWEAGRKYHISYRVKTLAATSSMYNPRYITSTSTSSEHPSGSFTTTAGTWMEFSTDFTIPTTHTPSTSSDFISLYCNPISGAANTVYYDDLVLIPYVKITYHANGGSGAPDSEYALADSYTVSSAAPARRGFTFLGWALSDGSVQTVDTVALTGGDVDLYAVWEPVSAQQVISYSFLDNTPGSADGTISVIAPEEAADYTAVSLYFADDNGRLESYTAFATLTLDAGAAAYSMSGGRAFPKEATRLCAVFSADGAPELPYWYTIPAEKRFDSAEQPLFTFYAISDIHLADYWPEMAVNRTRAINDIHENKPDFTVINGDLVNQGETAQFSRLDSFLDTQFNSLGMPVFITNGNHEFHINDRNSLDYDRDALLNSFDRQLTLLREMGYKIRRDGDSLWYSAVVENRKFIFLSTPNASEAGVYASTTVSAEQLAFLDTELYDCEKSNRTAFVFSHIPLYGVVPHSTSGIANSAAVTAVLNKHPNTVFISAHTHSNLSLDLPFVKVGSMTDSFTQLNDSCAVWLEDGSSKYGPYEVSFSAGQIIEVYTDKILVKARKFADPCVFFGHGLYRIPLPGANAVLPDVTIAGGRPANGVTLTAELSGEGADGDYTYEWSVAGDIIGTENVCTLSAKGSYGGEYVILRVYDAAGNYASARTAEPFAGVTLHYDANGGSGSVPADTLCIDGMSVPLDTKTRFPVKNGAYFIGWASTPDALRPEAEITVNGDTTAYAVYIERPFFGFDTNFCGWSPNSVVKTSEIKDGTLCFSADPKDMYFTLSGIRMDAASHPYMRIKVRYDSGSGDGMFFAIEGGSGFSQNTRIPLSSGTKVAESNGYGIYEYDLTALSGVKDYWNGTVSSLRYDALGAGGAGSTDYIAFTDKKGVFRVSVLFDEASDTASLGDDSAPCSIVSAVCDAGTVTVTLTPDAGYEFTTPEDVLAFVTVNGKAPLHAAVDGDGTAHVTAAVTPCVTVGGGDALQTQSIVLDAAANGKDIFVAAYSTEHRLIGTALLRKAALPDGRLFVKTPADAVIKVFVFDTWETLRPICPPLSYE